MKKYTRYLWVASMLVIASCHHKTVPSSSSNNGKIVTETGYASYYADKFVGRPTASGEIYDASKLTAAHKTLSFGTIVKITNLNNRKSVIVKVNDRGPFVAGRIIDLSKTAAKQIDMLGAGVVKVKIEYRKG
jgi:rare lipoprotein A